MKLLLLVFFLSGLAQNLNGQTPANGDYAISFDGVDDFIDVGNIYDDLELPITISAWILMDLRGLGTIFASQDNAQTYNGFHFYVVQSAIIIEYGDGLGNVSADFRRGKSGPVDKVFGKWVNVTAVIRGPSDIDLFLNGSNIGGNYIGNSHAPMNSSFPLEPAKIGFRSAIGIKYYFQGVMDELRIWNKPLSENDIRDQMCRRLTGHEPGLIGYWDFNESRGSIAMDKSPNHFVGQLRGDPKRVFSGAPVGDESVFFYSTDWQQEEVVFKDSLDSVRVGEISGNPDGIHIYKVNAIPSQSSGLNAGTTTQPYFGIFAAANNDNTSFAVNYTHEGTEICRLFSRRDNSVSSWVPQPANMTGVKQRVEVIKELLGSRIELDLGPDKELCVLSAMELSPLKDTTLFQFTWQDGSTLSTFPLADFGTYWVTVDNGCSQASDTIAVSNAALENIVIPNVFTPNDDLFNQYFEIDSRLLGSSLEIFNRWGNQVYESPSYQNDWDGKQLPSGVYFYRLMGGACPLKKSGTVTILR